MISERTSVGLDVHARSVVATALDPMTGELFKEQVVPSRGHLGWLAPPAWTGRDHLRGGTDRVRTRPGTDRGQIRCEVAPLPR